MLRRFIRKLKSEFGFRINVAVMGLIVFVSFSFTLFSIFQQRAFMIDRMINDGKVLSRMLAYSSRIGVFSENNDLLQDPVQGILKQTGVLEVSIFNAAGKPLEVQTHVDNPPENHADSDRFIELNQIKKMFREDVAPKYFELSDQLAFWAPVISQENVYSQESLFFNLDKQQAPVVDRITGYVKILIDRRLLDRQIEILLIRAVVIGILFLILGSLLSIAITKQIIKPLNRLKYHVNRVGSIEQIEQIPVETQDEIGNLAKALNDMSISLKSRENALLASRQRLRLLSSKLLQVQEEERRRLSRELHDGLGQSLAILKHQTRAVEKEVSQMNSALAEKCELATIYVTQIINDLRRISKDLSPSILEDIGFEAALKWLIKIFIDQHRNATVEAEIDDIGNRLSKDAQTNLYRLCQEALTNIGKYAQANHIFLHLKNDGEYVNVLIEDDGIGFDLQKAFGADRVQRGLGLTTMEERAHILGTELKIESSVGKGTKIALRIQAALN